jgi:hypothetical protein
MKITKKQFDRLVEGLVKEQWADWELGLGEKPDEQDEKFPFPNDPDLHDNDLEDEDLNEQFEWTDEELASMGDEESDKEEADQWFSDFTGELTGTEDEDDDYPWDDEFVGKADRSERGMQEAKKKKNKSPFEKVRKPTAPPSRQHKDPTKYDRKRDKKNVDLNEMRPMSRRGSMMQGKGENVSSFFVNKMMAEIKRLLKGKMDWVDLDSIQRLEKALTEVARQAYSELDEVD